VIFSTALQSKAIQSEMINFKPADIEKVIRLVEKKDEGNCCDEELKTSIEVNEFARKS